MSHRFSATVGQLAAERGTATLALKVNGSVVLRFACGMMVLAWPGPLYNNNVISAAPLLWKNSNRTGRQPAARFTVAAS